MIRLEQLVRTFGTARAVDGVSLDVPDGSIVALLGPNGAGKTTTVRMAAGLIGITPPAEVLSDESTDLRALAKEALAKNKQS